MIIRQGDVLVIKLQNPVDLEKAKAKAKVFKEVQPEKGNVVLAYGEATGHLHGIDSTKARMYEVDGERYLRVSDEVKLTHQEHDHIVLEKGDYKVIRQREYTPQAIRPVWD